MFQQFHADQNSLPSINELLKSRNYSIQLDTDPWQFAVEISELRSHGLTHSDARRLLHDGYLEHKYEVANNEFRQRTFHIAHSTRFSDASCFILTEKGVGFAESVLHSKSPQLERPVWNLQRRELCFAGEVIKRFRCPAINQEALLSAFEEEGWQQRIDDPLPPMPGKCPKRRLHDTVKSLNRHHTKAILQFHGDGTGEGLSLIHI